MTDIGPAPLTKARVGLGLVMTVNAFSTDIGKEIEAAASTIIVGTAIAIATGATTTGSTIAITTRHVLRLNSEQPGGVFAQDRAAVGIT